MSVLKEILDRLGFIYNVDEEYSFSEEEIKSLLNTQQDFITGKTTARSWEDIKDDLNRAYS